MTYATTHLLNHTLGLVSLDALVAGRHVFAFLWLSPPVTAILVAAFFVHLVLGLARLWQRTTWRMPFWEAIQLVLGLAIPLLGALHIMGTFVIERCCGVRGSYVFVLAGLWPDQAWRQTAFLLAVWIHGCIGIHYWLRLRPGYRRAQRWLVLPAVLLPCLALLGFVDGGRAVLARAALDPGWLPGLARLDNWPDTATVAWAYATEDRIVWALAALIAGIVLVDLLRGALTRRRNRVRVTYDGGRVVTFRRGTPLLEVSRAAGIAHAAVCGGRGRCSTCRVRVTRGLEDQTPPSPAERRVLERIGAEADVRLACQLRPTRDLAVTMLMQPDTNALGALRRMDPNQGSEREIAVMFADLRDFTRLSETRLPYDVVFILNRYFTVMGAAIEREGGHVDKFVGDGIMALFGLEKGAGEGARASLAAASAMGEALAALNDELAHELKVPLRMGIGIHAGPTIVGELGYRRAVSLTAIGDTVNTASRLETLSKELSAQLVISAHLAELAGVDLPAARPAEAELRGRRARLPVLAFTDARDAWPAAVGLDRPVPWIRRIAALMGR
ncbi:MAG TPA: adenylate/guanylate cyclase domain-containing protein [Geminicoccaceae bacterium]|nr:adenylate/guanylate cyclase domain-containing protein [Geminicoccus sp.]HMU48845.1 adenylate/guanylate cyclase domain-containing protein [Geminicoccaceae bacterium]